MEDVLQFKGSNKSHFPLALYANFHYRVLMRVTQIGGREERIRVTDALLGEYSGFVDVLVERTRTTLGTGKTADLDELDAVRDGIIPCISHTIEAASWSPLAAAKEASRVLTPVFAPYKNIQNEANNTETTLIDGLLLDLRKTEYTEHIAALHLDEVLTALEEANENYRLRAELRTNERNANRQALSTKELRRQTDAVYQRICDYIYASELIPAQPEDVPIIETLIGEINAIIDESNASYNRSKAQKEGDKEPEEGTETNPEEA